MSSPRKPFIVIPAQAFYCHPRESGDPGYYEPLLEIPSRKAARMSTYYVYILASRRNGTLYIGITNDLSRRVYEHKNGLIPGFTSKYGAHQLVYYETFEDVQVAIEREK